jgi:RNA polymerase sigma-70 factor (ECF subfamily)
MQFEVALERGGAGDTVAGDAALDAALDVALAQARRGEDAGFLTLYRAIQPRLLRYLRVRTTDNADDVAAETWLHVVRDLARFRGNADDFRAWVFTLARNRSVDAARASAARPSVSVADVTVLGVGSLAPSAESQALERMSTEHALRLVATLPPDVAEMVALRVIAGLDPATVGEIVGKSAGAVRVAVHRALAVLSGRPGVSPVEVTS